MSFLLETPRLRLREMIADDADHAFALNNDPEVLRYTGDDPFATVEEARDFLVAYPAYKRDGFGRWAVELHDGTWLGWCGLRRQVDGTVDLGYRLLRAHWGQGYATEAGRACIDLGFTRFGLDTIIARVVRANVGSVRVLEKLGMHYWKTDATELDAETLIYRVERG